ncbi:MAG: LysR family transcriptional regulator [Lachnospiraceae bacterium]
MRKEKQNPNSFPDSPVNPEEINFDTKTLRYIVAIVDQGGLSNAAESLFLSQPALSRYLKGVEDTLGTPIFYRKHNRLILTNAGKIFINGVRSMLHIEQDVLNRLHASKLDRKTTLTIAVQNLFARFLEETVHPMIQRQFPDVTLHLNVCSGDRVKSLVSDGTVDLGFFMGNPSETPYFAQECLFTSELVFYAAPQSPGLAESQRNGFRLRNFADESMMMSLENTFLSQIQTRLLQENGISSPKIITRGRLNVLLDLIRLGYGNVILPRRASHFSSDHLFSFDPPESYSCIAAWCQDRTLSPLAQSYLESARTTFPSFAEFSEM